MPKIYLCNDVIKFLNNVIYLGVFLNNNLNDDNDISRQVCYLYEKSYQLKVTFSKPSYTVKIYYLIIIVHHFMLVIYGLNIYVLH